MTNLYPLRFDPQVKHRVWGGDALCRNYGKKNCGEAAGESWEICGLQGDLSVVTNGFLAGNDIAEITEVYMGDLVGEEIYEKFGIEFPLLIKLLDAREMLSVQVHPDDTLARKRHSAYGKSELWYVLEAEPGAVIYSGFNRDITADEYSEALANKRLHSLMNKINPVAGDVFYLPAGTIHSVGGGVVVAEIQQASDITYRIYDWDRKSGDGVTRELHNDLAIDALSLKKYNNPVIHHPVVPEEPLVIADNSHFHISLAGAEGVTTRDYSLTDSFVIIICTSGSMDIKQGEEIEKIKKGDSVLIPAITDMITITGDSESAFLEVYIP
jgi:mannose-6-phosphate isomerase